MKAYNKANPDRTGSQINEDIFVQAHCLKKGLDYVGACGPAHFDNHYKLSKMLNLPLPFKNLPPSYAKYILITPNDYSKAIYPDPNILIDQNFIGTLRNNFLLAFNAPPHSNPRVAVHIRRGDVKADNQMRYIPNSYYVDVITKIKHISQEAEIFIFSESHSSESFDVFRQLGCKLFLDADLEFTWKEMIFADVLVMSKGSFSYVPAIYNSNFVIYYPAWYTKLAHWHHTNASETWKNLELFLLRRYDLHSRTEMRS